MSRSLPILTACLLALSFLAGCPSDNNDNNEDNNANNQTDMSEDMPKEDMPVDMAKPDEWKAKYQLIFTDMKFNSDSPGSGILNTVVRKSFRMDQEYPTIILIDIKNLPEAEGEVMYDIKGGAGVLTETDGTFAWDTETPDTYYKGSLNKATGAIAGTFDEFSFISTIPTEGDPLRVVLPINELTYDATVAATADGGLSISNGKLTGFVTKAQADTIMITIPPSTDTVTLTSILKEDKLNYDSTGDTTNDAWLLGATFTAEPAVIK